jgi:hypothetical protein
LDTMDVILVAWTYKECEVKITVVLEPPRKTLTPFVEIFCKDTPKRQTILTTSKYFSSPIMAEHCGQNMAREWIDKQLPAGGFKNKGLRLLERLHYRARA